MRSNEVHPPGHAPFALFNHTVNVGLVALLRHGAHSRGNGPAQVVVA
jgi:hypothetical protein